MANHLSKFSPNLADTTKPLRDLLNKSSQWTWEEPQRAAFEAVKDALTTTPVLALYDVNRETIVSADASSYGLGAVLLQRQPDGCLKPIAYISRSLTPTEQRYAQLEKEALAFTWACERFSDYLLGLEFHIHTDHKPLVPLFSSKNLEELPIRVQRFRLRMMRFRFTISHVPGKDLAVADALSRAPSSDPRDADLLLQREAAAFVDVVIKSIPATVERLSEIRQHQTMDRSCQQLAEYCTWGWPDKRRIPVEIRPYHPVASELSVVQGLLMRGNRIVIPSSLRLDILEKLHTGHQGITKCRERARQSVWWPGLSKQLEDLVKGCSECCKAQVQRAEPLLPSKFPELPWQKVGTDLFEWEKSMYLLVVDYFSRYIEIALLKQTTAEEIISHTKSIFARHGIPQIVISDNGPQFSSEAFVQFSANYGFLHRTSSPYHPQGNGEAERAVQTIKSLLKKGGDPYLALMAYRATPIRSGYSPSELLMGRKLRTNVPIAPQQLRPKLPDFETLTDRETHLKAKQKENFDKHHGARELPDLSPGDEVWLPEKEVAARVQEEVAPRSYTVETPDGSYRRNRRALIQLPEGDPEITLETGDDTEAAIEPQTQVRRSTRESRCPDRLDPSWTNTQT